MNIRHLLPLLALAPLMACANQMVSQAPGLGTNVGADFAAYAGHMASTSPACPAMEIHLTQTGPTSYGGLAFDPAMNGAMSMLAGTRAADGTIAIQATPMAGHSGPAGTFTGRLRNGALMVSMTGACPMTDVVLMSLPMSRGNAS